MKFHYSAILVAIVILVPFLVGVYSGAHAKNVIENYQNNIYDIADERILVEIKNAEKVEEQVRNVTDERHELIKNVKDENSNSTFNVHFTVFFNNLKRAVFSILSLGLMFIPIFYETGILVGYNLSAMDLSMTLILFMELVSHSLFGFSAYTLLISLLMGSNLKKSYNLALFLCVLGTLILFMSTYLEVAF